MKRRPRLHSAHDWQSLTKDLPIFWRMSEKGMPAVEEGTLLWSPDDRFTGSSNMKAFMDWLSEKKNLHFPDYGSLWEWSTLRLEDFWLYLMEYADVVHSGIVSEVLASRNMPPQGVVQRHHAELCRESLQEREQAAARNDSERGTRRHRGSLVG